MLGKLEEPFGAVRVYYPSEKVSRKKFYFRSATGNANERLEKVIRNVIQYGISQRVDRLLTWQGVSAELLNVQHEKQIAIRMNAESARQKAEDEIDILTVVILQKTLLKCIYYLRYYELRSYYSRHQKKVLTDI